MSQSTIFLHIGMPKAASTYFQRAIYPILMPGRYIFPGGRNAKKPSYRFRRNVFSVRRFSDAFHQKSDFWRQHGDEFLRKFLSSFLNGDLEPNSVLISDEAVTRLNHFNIKRMPGAFNRQEIENNFRLFTKAAQRIGFKRTKILLIIRRQDILLASSYAQLSRKIAGASQKDFEKRIYRLIRNDSNPEKTTFYSVDYKSFCQSIVRSLPEENLTVIPLEQISYDFPGFINKLMNFLEVEESCHAFSKFPVNSRSAGENKWDLRPLLLFKSSQVLKSSRIYFEMTVPRYLMGREKYIELTQELSSEIMQHYADSNKKLSEMLNVDLCKFGYWNP